MAARLQAILAHLTIVTSAGFAPDSFVTRLMSAGYAGSTRSDTQLKNDTRGITETSARTVLDELETAIRAPHYLAGPAFRSAYDKAIEGAQKIERFTKEHPVWTTIIALGILAILYPAAIKALGFGLGGVAKASYAAAWQSTYGAQVPAKSLFSYLQYLGATMLV